ncbi:MAG: serine--tRNA ligase [Candidatus Omnitrophica bacterium]|nr:serine--tRNA ligase [Candidatus Omnitrophota bacterium]
MLDLKFIRENADIVRQALENKKEKDELNDILDLDKRRREKCAEVEQMKRMLNKASEKIAQINKEKQPLPMDKILENKALSQEIRRKDATLKTIEDTLQQLLLSIPNIPHESVPVGPDESFNKIVRTWGKEPEFDFKIQNHVELGQKLDILDFPRAAKITGSGFSLYKGAGARLERALINFMLDMHTKKHGYTEISPPFLVNRKSMIGTGQLPKLEEDMYKLSGEDFFLIPTAEVPVTNIHREEILKEQDLPVYYTAYTPCFRREAGSYGKDTKGLIRIHQFDKVEMVKFVKPKDSYKELESLVENAEEVLQALGLYYRVSALATGDLSFAASKCYDLEAWAPGTKAWLEVSSCSNFEDFQARRANIKYKPSQGGKTSFVHTLNGSGVALPRIVICLLETHQRADNSIGIPEALRPFMDGQETIQENCFRR